MKKLCALAALAVSCFGFGVSCFAAEERPAPTIIVQADQLEALFNAKPETRNPKLIDSDNPLSVITPLLGSRAKNAFAWLFIISTAFKLGARRLCEWLTSLFIWVRGTPDSADDHWIDVLVASPFYRGVAAFCRLLFRAEIPLALPPVNAERGTRSAEQKTGPAPAIVLALLCVLCAFVVTGCASHKSTLLRTTHKNGDVTELTRSTTRTLFDSKSKLADYKAVSLSGSNSQAVGIGSLSQSGSGSNVVASLEIALKILKELQGK